MNLENYFLVAKDEDEILRPMAGIWRNNDAGRISVERFLAKENDLTVVICELKEVEVPKE